MMTSANVRLTSGPDADPAAGSAGSARASRTWPAAFGDAASFALVGVAAVGLVLEQLDVSADNARGVLEVLAGACAGAIASAVYGRLETRKERLARARLLAWTCVRFFVAFELMRYGMAKLVGMQFYPRYSRLDTRAADLSPQALAWVFFGRTYGYQAASGVVEVAAAVLLCFRRTAALGACALLAVMTNVVLMDFFYAVPVRLFASVYLVMGLYVLSIDARRFWAFFLGDGPVPPRAYLSPAAGPAARIVTACAVVLVLVLPCADIVRAAQAHGLFRADALEGSWRVERSAGLEGVAGEAGAWEKVYFEKGAFGSARLAGGGRVTFKTDIDETAKALRLYEIGDPPPSPAASGRELAARYTLVGARLHTEGTREGTPFSIDLVRDLPR